MTASMKVPTRRWGNNEADRETARALIGLNESPHPKVGKSADFLIHGAGKFGLNESPHPKVGKFTE